MVADVLEEAPFGADITNKSFDVGPEMAGIVSSALSAGNAEGLTGVSANEAIHESSKTVSGEGRKIAPDRARGKSPFFHATKKDAARVGFPFRHSDTLSVWDHSFKSDVQAAVSSTEGDIIESFGHTTPFGGINHIHFVLLCLGLGALTRPPYVLLG